MKHMIYVILILRNWLYDQHYKICRSSLVMKNVNWHVSPFCIILSCFTNDCAEFDRKLSYKSLLIVVFCSRYALFCLKGLEDIAAEQITISFTCNHIYIYIFFWNLAKNSSLEVVRKQTYSYINLKAFCLLYKG